MSDGCLARKGGETVVGLGLGLGLDSDFGMHCCSSQADILREEHCCGIGYPGV